MLFRSPLSLAGDGPVCSWLPMLSPLFCEQAWWCLSLGLFAGLAIPGSGLLCQVSSLRLPSGHSGPFLTLSNAACTSFPSPRLLVVGSDISVASLLGVTVGHVICGFKLFIYFSSHLCCPLSCVQFCAIKYIHTIVQPSQPSTPRTLLLSQAETLYPSNINSSSSLPPVLGGHHSSFCIHECNYSRNLT